MTSRYNGYFYAGEILKENTADLEKKHKDDFSTIIPVFIYPTPQEATGLKGNMDKAIVKLSKVIHRHTITTKAKKEIPGACKWIDDSYILMGRSYFYERDFFAANESFDYVAKTYEKLPTRFLGMMWLIRSYDELGSISESESLIDLIADDKKFPKEYAAEFAAIEAYHFILRENYGGALKPLNKLISLTKKRKLRARYIFIEAQLEQKLEKNKKAEALYTEVIKINPSYELTFNAQINRAQCFDANSGNAAQIKKELLKMLKDEKNLEHLDQIYYVLAEIAEKEKEKPLCIDYLKKSVRTSVSNNNQKARSYLKLADIYFDGTQYRLAQAYYDSTVTLIKPDFPNYEVINNKKKSLSDLVHNINIISNEDSLQALAKMDPKERDAKIEKIAEKIAADEKKKEEEKQNQIMQVAQVNQLIQQNSNSGTQNNGQWYFYNTTTVNFGVNEFKKKWGERKLEDNWRRSNKEIVLEDVNNANTGTATNEQTSANVDSTTNVKKTGPPKKTISKGKEAYMQGLPLTADAMKRSDEKIIEAYYALGSIYKEQLANNAKAAETFEEMINRYPENKYTLTVYYQLYRLFLAMKNSSKADYYANIIITKYPDTVYAQLIKNPGYDPSKVANISVAEQMYTETFQLYKDEKYPEVITQCHIADTALGKNPYVSRFDLLCAMSIGHTEGIEAFEKALTRIIIKYPKDVIKDKAQEYLDLIKKQKSSGEISTAKKDSIINNAAQYIFNKDAEYYFVFIYDGSLDINKIKGQFSNINTEYYSLDNLTVESIMLDADKQMINVKSFTGKEKAMMYYNLITKDKKDIFTGLEAAKIKTFVISSENFPVFYKAKNIGDYVAFFQGNFLKDEKK